MLDWLFADDVQEAKDLHRTKSIFLKKLRLNRCMTMGLERPQTMNFNVPFSDTSEVIYDTAEQYFSD